MKNLKRVLSLGLASVMLLGMMVMGASAATFSDADDIKNTEAVNLMVALNVINGKDDGRFDPNGTVTRAEMAKMITMILFGGEEATLTTGGTAKFADTANHWARKYIEYCAGDQLKIIAGMGDGTFAPDAQVTGTQAAKMALVALGYDAKVYGFEGTADWEVNINYVANSKDANLYNGLKNIDPSKPITRDQAAKILYNALYARIVKPQYTITSNGIETAYVVSENNPTLLADKFDVEIFEGTLEDVTYNGEDKVFVYTFGSDFANTDENGLADVKDGKFAENVSDLLMRKVEVVTDAEGNILGIGASKDSTVLSTGTWGGVKFTKEDGTITKIDGAAYTDGTTKFYVDGTEKSFTATSGAVVDAEPFYTYAVINNSGTKGAETVVLYSVSVQKITFVGKTSITTSGVTGSGNSYTIEDCDIYAGAKKGDYVVVTAGIEGTDEDGKEVNAYTIEKAEIVTGTVTATKGDDDEQIRADGTWYKLIVNDEGNLNVDVTRGNEYDLVVINGYVVAADKVTAATSTDVAFVIARNEITSNDTIEKGAQTVRLMFADGTTKTVTVDRVYDKASEEFKTVDNTYQAELYTLYYYTVTSAGNYRLTAVADDNEYEVEDTLSSVKNGRANDTLRFANDAILFVVEKATMDGDRLADGDVSVLTGAEVAAWKAIQGDDIEDTLSPVYADKASNGFTTISLGVIVLDDKIPGKTGKSTETYGILTAAPITVREDGTTYRELTIWTENGEKEIKVENGDVTGTLANKAVVKFDDLGNGYAEKMTVLTGAAAPINGAVTGYDGDEDLIIATAEDTNGIAAKITDDTVILYFNTKTNKGAEGGEIVLANQNTQNKLACNVKFISETDEDDEDVENILLLIVDINNQLDEVDDLTISGGSSGGDEEEGCTHENTTWAADDENDGKHAETCDDCGETIDTPHAVEDCTEDCGLYEAPEVTE